MAETMDGARAPRRVKRVSQVLIVLGVLALLRLLPAAEAVSSLAAWVEDLGALAPVAFVGAYVAVTLLMMPASLLSLAAGALFGLWTGTLVVVAGATLGMAATFLIGRYLARPAVERRFARNPRFAAIDRAVGQGGWRIVALLRLSPAVPFNLQNYLYGLTAIRFWPCILTSAVTILPGTFTFVYLGYASRAGLGALGGADSGRGPGQWALMVLGLAATITATVYITKLARRAIQAQEPLESAPVDRAASEEASPGGAGDSWGGALAYGALAVLVVSAAGCAHFQPRWIAGLFGPPGVTMDEAYDGGAGGAEFDHAPFDALLKKHVNRAGGVDYAGLRADSEALEAYVRSLAAAPFEDLGRDEKLALLINAYNAFTLQLIVEWLDKDIESIRDIPGDQRWDGARWNVAGHTWSLNQIEHEQIRPKFAEPNIHWALVCAARDCPPLRREAYIGAGLREQLEDQARIVHTNGSRWFELAPGGGTLRLTPLYDWYGGDFEQAAGGVLAYAARYAPELAELLEAGRPPGIEWKDYDWSLNSQENLP